MEIGFSGFLRFYANGEVIGLGGGRAEDLGIMPIRKIADSDVRYSLIGVII